MTLGLVCHTVLYVEVQPEEQKEHDSPIWVVCRPLGIVESRNISDDMDIGHTTGNRSYA